MVGVRRHQMCKTKSATATAAAPSMARSSATTPTTHGRRSPRGNTNGTHRTSYSTSSAALSTSSSSAASSLEALKKDSLPDLPLLLTFAELAAATKNFSPAHRLAPGSSNSFRCALRGHPAAVFRRALRRDPAEVSARLAVLGHCHHAAIARLYGAAASPDGALFLAYELVPGAAPLSALLRGANNPSFTPLASWHSRLRLAADACDALSYVHLQAGTVHNRLSSSSVLVCGQGPLLRAKLAHFGSADLAGELPDDESGDKEARQRRTGSRGRRIEGTRGYMAPELTAGGSPTRRSDVFALGVLLLELVSGQEPVRYEFNKATGEYERTSLIESASAACGGEGGMRRWVDRRLKDSFPVEAAEALTMLALQCVAKDPPARPEMSWVAAKVSKLFLEAQDWADKFRIPTDISISMAPR
ncbi:lysM domain receptor-like kinase 3 [Aegilops tauschii subsp. strangulata]|uniref:Protein kinase domain-containing protein n=1 Tax=Aegilops tauschii subsp. strangulata TaxID=200361 RepID=A0A453Q3V6_AEGTS|nr:protein LYK5 [Aegilops tauschii subsp. strangulata]